MSKPDSEYSRRTGFGVRMHNGLRAILAPNETAHAATEVVTLGVENGMPTEIAILYDALSLMDKAFGVHTGAVTQGRLPTEFSRDNLTNKFRLGTFRKILNLEKTPAVASRLREQVGEDWQQRQITFDETSYVSDLLSSELTSHGNAQRIHVDYRRYPRESDSDTAEQLSITFEEINKFKGVALALGRNGEHELTLMYNDEPQGGAMQDSKVTIRFNENGRKIEGQEKISAIVERSPLSSMGDY